MSDWEFLHEMRDLGYSAEEIADAAGSGAAPWEWEYIDREWIETQLKDASKHKSASATAETMARSREGLHESDIEPAEIFYDLVECAARYYENTGRFLQIWGELGELFAEIEFGLRRHGPHEAGSDGTIDGKLVEVKTISPEKSSDRVLVKSQGNFEQLLIVRIDRHFQFQGKLFDRSELRGGLGKFLRGRLPEDSSKG